jgi:hypothetical protein
MTEVIIETLGHGRGGAAGLSITSQISVFPNSVEGLHFPLNWYEVADHVTTSKECRLDFFNVVE